MSKMFIIESKATDGRYGLPDEWMPETLPLEELKAKEYRLIELEEEKPKKKKKGRKKS